MQKRTLEDSRKTHSHLCITGQKQFIQYIFRDDRLTSGCTKTMPLNFTLPSCHIWENTIKWTKRPFKCYVMQWGVGGGKFRRTIVTKLYVSTILALWGGGCQISRKKCYITLERPQNICKSRFKWSPTQPRWWHRPIAQRTTCIHPCPGKPGPPSDSTHYGTCWQSSWNHPNNTNSLESFPILFLQISDRPLADKPPYTLHCLYRNRNIQGHQIELDAFDYYLPEKWQIFCCRVIYAGVPTLLTPRHVLSSHILAAYLLHKPNCPTECLPLGCGTSQRECAHQKA